MFNHIKDSFLWAQALSSFDKGHFEQARTKLLAINGKRRLSSEYFAVLATIYIGLREIDFAKELLVKAMHRSLPTREDYRSYIELYCRYYLSSIDGDEGGKVKYLQASMQADAPTVIRRWLPLS